MRGFEDKDEIKTNQRTMVYDVSVLFCLLVLLFIKHLLQPNQCCLLSEGSPYELLFQKIVSSQEKDILNVTLLKFSINLQGSETGLMLHYPKEMNEEKLWLGKFQSIAVVLG